MNGFALEGELRRMCKPEGNHGGVRSLALAQSPEHRMFMQFHAQKKLWTSEDTSKYLDGYATRGSQSDDLYDGTSSQDTK
jgi:hypothetical protein